MYFVEFTDVWNLQMAIFRHENDVSLGILYVDWLKGLKESERPIYNRGTV
jgi:peptide deformylase